MLVFFVLPQDLSIVASSLAATVVAVVEFVYYFDSITIIGDLYNSPIGKTSPYYRRPEEEVKNVLYSFRSLKITFSFMYKYFLLLTSRLSFV